MKPKKIATRWLILFFCLVAVLCAGLLIWGNQNASAGQIAVISVDGDVWQEADLSNVQESYLLTVPGGSNEILVEPGQISVSYTHLDVYKRQVMSRKPPWLWVLASVVVFWGFCIWRSSKSDWSGNMIWN